MLLLDTATVAIVSTVVVGLVSTASIIVSAYNSRQQRQHERQMAHDARTYEIRRDVYLESADYLYAVISWVARTHPVYSPGGAEPPDPPDDAERLRLDSRLAVFGSPDVVAAANEFYRQVRDFSIYADTMTRARADPSGRLTAPWKELEASRDAANAALVVVIQRMRADLNRPGVSEGVARLTEA